MERAVSGLLKIDESQGLIRNIRYQVHVPLTDAQIIYIADFCVFDVKLGEDVWVEAKGFETAIWRIKRRLWLGGYGPGLLRVYKGTAARPFLFEELTPKRA